ncbi:MAG: imm11 family protein [Asticcacaulis sp.]
MLDYPDRIEVLKDYIYADVIRFADALDRKRTVGGWSSMFDVVLPPSVEGPLSTNRTIPDDIYDHGYIDGGRFVFRTDLPEDLHLFRLPYYPDELWVSRTFVEACLAEGLTGWDAWAWLIAKPYPRRGWTQPV